jgi:pimeloyl-ACP methyl ester carboxylesterase
MAIERGEAFRHVVYRNAAPLQDDALHIYLEGDGEPYWQPNVIAADPTPRQPLMLHLMALDPAHSIYLGRPCYFALYHDPGCGPLYWTLRRYAPEVVDSLDAVLRQEIAKAGAKRVELFGHSGGGTLAVLLAQRDEAVSRVITIGANLDVEAWSRLHHYSPLRGSLNPIDLPASRPTLQVLHLVGANDANTPPDLVEAAGHARGGEPVRVIAHFDHHCCWESMWPGVLADLSR